MEVANIVMSAEISAVITRADGTVEDLGVIDRFNREDALPEGQRRNLERKAARDGHSRN